MKTLLALIEKFEGMHRRLLDGRIGPYLCPAGYPTQGLGLLVKDLSVEPISEEEARERCQRALPYYINGVLKYSPNLIRYPIVLEAISDFAYNLGLAAYAASTLRRAVAAEDWDWVQRELRRWINGGGRRLPGLIARREVECSIIAAATGSRAE